MLRFRYKIASISASLTLKAICDSICVRLCLCMASVIDSDNDDDPPAGGGSLDLPFT